MVEVVLGTAILGSLLVTILIGASRLQVAAARSDGRITACQVANALLEQWWPKPDEFPRTASGPVPGREGWSWQTRVVENPAAQALKGETVALEIFAPGRPADAPVARVEVLLPEKTDADGRGPDAR